MKTDMPPSAQSLLGSSGTIRGFSAMADAPVSYPLSHPEQSSRSPAPVTKTSRPVFDLLSGSIRLPVGLALIESRMAEPLPEGADSDAHEINLLTPDPEIPTLGITFFAASVGQHVVPALQLSASGAGWIAEPLAIFGGDLPATIRFHSPSVAALLRLSANAFDPILNPAREAEARLEYLRNGGKQFYPRPVNLPRWRIASMWPSWQRRRLNFIARELELSTIERRPEKGSDQLRQICSRDLKLKIGDRTDS
jgi:hypothetical protein